LKIPPNEPKFIVKTIKDLNITSLGFEDEFLSVKRYNKWRNFFDNIQLEGSSEVLTDARVIKTEWEIKQMKKAAKLGIIGFNTIYEECEAGMTEKELAARAEFAMRKAGSEGTSFDTIVASGENSAYPHANTSDKTVKKGDLIIVDIGARFNGYCSDMTRTFIFGDKNEKNFDKKARLVNLVNDGQKKALDEINAGRGGSEMDTLVRDYFKATHEEWGERFIHSLGHGVGLEIHEEPYLSQKSETVLKRGMCVTVEPGLYVPGFGGARTEDLVVIKEKGYENLTPAEKFYY
jgi:Xaa-Pro aminopeptidase